MPRLTQGDWDDIRARYEVAGESVSSLAKEFDINHAAISRRAKAEGWKQAGYHEVTTRKVNAVKEIAKIEEEKSQLPIKHQRLIDNLSRKELEAQDIGADLKAAILLKSKDLLSNVTESHQVLTLAKTHSELLRQPQAQTQVAVINGGQDQQKDTGPKLELVLNQPPDRARK